MNQLSVENRLLSIICSVFDAYSTVLFLPAGDGGSCMLAASYSLGDKIAESSSDLKGAGLVSWIARNGEPMLVPNVDQHQNVLGYYAGGEEALIKAFMGCPVPGGGVLCVDSKRQYSFSEKDCKILQLFAGLFGRADLSRQSSSGDDPAKYFSALDYLRNLRRRSKIWNTFIRDFLHCIAETTGFDYCAFASVEIPGESFVLEVESSPLLLRDGEPAALPMGGNIVGWVLRNNECVVQDSAAEQLLFGRIADAPAFQSVMCAPVTLNKSTRGAVCLGSAALLKVGGEMRSFVLQAVDYLGLYLETMYLKDRLQNMLPKAQLYRNGPSGGGGQAV